MTRMIPAPLSKRTHLAGGLELLRLARRFTSGPLVALESSAGSGRSGRLQGLCEGLLASVDAVAPGAGPRSVNVMTWASDAAVAGGEDMAAATRTVRSWIVPAAVHFDPEALRVGHRCPVCKADTALTTEGVRRAALWITDVTMCLACHDIKDTITAVSWLRADGYKIGRTRRLKADNYPRIQGDLDAAA